MGTYNFAFYIDINECTADTDDCDQVCTNTDGSFTCSCNSGYTLDSNERTCNGLLAKLLYINL